jgi:hypothetical protein
LPLQYNNTNNKSLANVLKSISDDKILSIFQAIAADANYNNGEIGLNKLHLSRRLYYYKISTMRKTGLIKRRRGRYYLTPFGKVVYCCTMITKNALDNYYNLKAVEVTEDSGFSNEELSKLVNALIDNKEVKEFLTKKC